MPLTDKGKKIMKAMKKTYGDKKAKQVFYAMINEKKLKGVEKKTNGRHGRSVSSTKGRKKGS